MGSDWSRSFSVNGKMTTTTKHFDFPMKPSKKWDLSYVVEKLNDKVKIATRTFTYRAVGWEDIEVADGTFNALRSK